MDVPNLVAVLESFRSGGRCETALVERFGSSVACPDPLHAPFWTAQHPDASSPQHLLSFQRDGPVWLDSFPVLVSATFRLYGRQSQLVVRLAEALINTQEAHSIGVGLRCLEVALRVLPPEELDAEWSSLLKALFGLKASLQSDVNLPLAIDRLLAFYAVRRKLPGHQFLDFIGATDLHDEACFSVLREFVRLCVREGTCPTLPEVPLPDLSQMTCAQISKLACIAVLQDRSQALQELLSCAESCWTLQEVWQLVADIVMFCEYTGLPARETFLSFALRLARECLHSAAGLRRYRSRLEALLKVAGTDGEALCAFSTQLCSKFREAFEEKLPTLSDLSRLMKWMRLDTAGATELLKALLDAWRGAAAFQSDSDLSNFCDAVLVVVQGAIASSEGWHLVLRLLLRLLPDIEAVLSSPERAYTCHFLMFLWRDVALSVRDVHNAKTASEAVRSGLATQLRYGEAFCELDHFPCACFALLQGAAALMQLLPRAEGPSDSCLRLCQLFERRSVDAAFIDAVLLVALRSSAPEGLWSAAERFCAGAEPVALQKSTLMRLTSHFLALPEAEAAAHPLGAVLRAACRPRDALSAEELIAVERHMGLAWGDGPVPGGRHLCEACGENLEELCGDVELALRCPLNLDCIGD